MSANTPPLSTLSEKWQELVKLDAKRESVSKIIQDQITQANRRVHELEREKERMQAYEQQLIEGRASLQEKCKALQESVDAAPFVVMLVDGDITQFLDEFVKEGSHGGRNAAQTLKRRLEEYLREITDFTPHWKVMVHVYANLHGLLNAYVKAKVVLDHLVVRKFFTGFNRELPFFEFIDAGDDKEAADSKIKEYLKHYHGSANCRHVILVSSGDRGYAGFLRQFGNGMANISLVEAVPYEPSFREVAENFRTTSFPEVFKNVKLEAVSMPIASRSTAGTYADVANTTEPQPHMSPARQATRPVIAGSPTILLKFNRFGERLDGDLPHADKSILDRLKGAKLKPCARHHLTGTCERGDACSDSHRGSLDSQVKIALRRLARLNPCPNGKQCTDPHCVWSHHCMFDGQCAYFPCRFGSDMHGIDKATAEMRPA